VARPGLTATPQATIRKALITGVGGQDGIYLARHLLSQGFEVVGTSARPLGDRAVYLGGVHFRQHDVRDVQGFAALLDEFQPDHVYNLAGFSSVGQSWREAELVSEVNGLAVLRMLEQLLRFRDRCGWAPRFYQASSSEMFGSAGSQMQTETSAHHPRSPYAVAKSFAHHLTINYRESYGLFTSTGILFNHEGPLRGADFVTRKISRAAAAIAHGRADSVELGHLDIRRDWGSAADYVIAMHRMLCHAEPGDFIVATGQTRSLREVLSIAFAAAGLSGYDRYVRVSADLLRPADVNELCGDASRAEQILGWAHQASFETTIERMVAVDLQRLTTGVEECEDYV